MNSGSWLVSIIWCKIQLVFIYCGSQFYTISYYSLVKNETLVGFIVYSCWKKWNKATSKRLVLHSKMKQGWEINLLRLSMLKELTKIQYCVSSSICCENFTARVRVLTNSLLWVFKWLTDAHDLLFTYMCLNKSIRTLFLFIYLLLYYYYYINI